MLSGGDQTEIGEKVIFYIQLNSRIMNLNLICYVLAKAKMVRM
jgi:hypothetical protein